MIDMAENEAIWTLLAQAWGMPSPHEEMDDDVTLSYPQPKPTP